MREDGRRRRSIAATRREPKELAGRPFLCLRPAGRSIMTAMAARRPGAAPTLKEDSNLHFGHTARAALAALLLAGTPALAGPAKPAPKPTAKPAAKAHATKKGAKPPV